MESLAVWASQLSAGLGLGPLTSGRTGLQFKPEATKEKKKKRTRLPAAASSSSSPREAHLTKRIGDPVVSMPFQTNATLPLDIWFDVPETLAEGQKQVLISGPHGPLQVALPEGCKPGQRVRHRIGPKVAQLSVVPEGKAECETMTIYAPDGEQMQVTIPAGKKAGDEFEVSPPVIMVQVPQGAKPGDTLIFTAPDGRERSAKVPKDVPVLGHFEVPYEERPKAAAAPAAAPEGRFLRTKCTMPLDVSFNVPDILDEQTRMACVLGPHGPLQLQVPEGAKTGDAVQVRLGPKETIRAKVPEGLKEGDPVQLERGSGVFLQVVVPPGKMAGEEFDISPPVLMVRVPEIAEPGTKVVFNAPDGAEMTSVVPEGFAPASYFEVPLLDAKLAAAPAPASPQADEEAQREIAEMAPCESKQEADEGRSRAQEEAEEESREAKREEAEQQEEKLEQQEDEKEKEEEKVEQQQEEKLEQQQEEKVEQQEEKVELQQEEKVEQQEEKVELQEEKEEEEKKEEQKEKEEESTEKQKETEQEQAAASESIATEGNARKAPMPLQLLGDEAEEKPVTPKKSYIGFSADGQDKENQGMENSQPFSPGPCKAVLSPMGPQAVLSPMGPQAVLSPTGPKAVLSPTGPSAALSPTGPTAVLSPTGPTGLAPRSFSRPARGLLASGTVDLLTSEAPETDLLA